MPQKTIISRSRLGAVFLALGVILSAAICWRLWRHNTVIAALEKQRDSIGLKSAQLKELSGRLATLHDDVEQFTRLQIVNGTIYLPLGELARLPATAPAAERLRGDTIGDLDSDFEAAAHSVEGCPQKAERVSQFEALKTAHTNAVVALAALEAVPPQFDEVSLFLRRPENKRPIVNALMAEQRAILGVRGDVEACVDELDARVANVEQQISTVTTAPFWTDSFVASPESTAMRERSGNR